jgi:type VI secretion system protein ImpL
MRFSWEHLIAIGAGVLVVLLAWFSGSWFHLAGLDRIILSGGILAIGAAVIAGFVLWVRSKEVGKPPASPAPVAIGATTIGGVPTNSISTSGLPVASSDIDLLVREAANKVASARLGHGLRLGSLRQIFVLGEAGSGKTEAVMHSGLEPELLAGHVFQDGRVIPTPAANFWFARKTVLIEAASSVLADPRLWSRLVRRLTPTGLRAVFGSSNQGERAAVVCFHCEKLLRDSSGDSVTAAARWLRSRLEEMSQVLGSSFPVYVLFTGADCIPFFEDFVNTISSEESSQVLGVTLPPAAESPTSVYAERESRRLTTAFNNLFYSLAEYRIDLLSREPSVDRRAGTYEYPREFSKMSKRVVQLLVDLCRPSQLRAGPYLRGFYFTGTRMVTVGMGSPTLTATRENIMGAGEAAANATTILRQDELAPAPSWQSRTQTAESETRKVPQWVFLSHIFSHVLLQDRSALGASGVSSRGDFWRRILFSAVILLCFIWICGLIGSFFYNRSLESAVLEAAQTLQGTDAAAQQPSFESLQKFDSLRKRIQELEGYANSGVPWHLRWGLYNGDETLFQARRIYFTHFYTQILGQIQPAMVDTLRRLPATPGPNDEYLPIYDTLKAYLITTTNPDKSTPEFLSPVLQRNWTAGQNLDGNALALARAQDDFYASELKIQNPYSPQVDVQAQDHARDYLNRFGAVPRIYAAMQNVAAKQNPAILFYQEHPDAGEVIRSVPDVPGAFTRGGWGFMQNAIAHSDQYFRGEEWVLGGNNGAISNRSDLEAQLRSMYQTDFIKRWGDFLRNARVAAPYGNVEDGVHKLKKLSANESPLLALLCDASLNTSGRSADIDKAFGPAQAVAPSGCETRVPPALIPYVGGLAKLESCLESLASAAPDQKDAQRQQCNSTASEAKLVVTTQIMPSLPTDPGDHLDQTVQALLEAPISMPALPPPPQPKGSTPRDLCQSFSQIAGKFPFNPNYDSSDVTLQEFDGFFRPDGGALQQFIQANQGALVPQGAQYILKPGVKLDWDTSFLSFVSRARFVQQALYSSGGTGAAQLQYHFNVRATLPEGGINGVSFTLNGQTLKYPGGAQSSPFTWPGSGPQVASVSYQVGGGQDITLLSAQGPWAIVRLLSLPDAKVTASGSALSAEWHPLQPDRRTPLTISGSGKPIVVHLEFDSGGAPFVLQEGYFSNLTCRATR